MHTLSLLGASYLRPSLADLAIPFAGPSRPVWTAAGIIAAYGLAALSLSYYVRARIGVARWRMLHRYIALFWLLGAVHTVAAGTDAGEVWFVVLFGVVVGPPLAMLVARVDGARSTNNIDKERTSEGGAGGPTCLSDTSSLRRPRGVT